MAQKKNKPAGRQASKLTNKTQVSLSDEAVGCLAVACLFRGKTMSEIVDKLITTNLAEFAPMRGSVQFGVQANASGESNSASGGHSVDLSTSSQG